MKKKVAALGLAALLCTGMTVNAQAAAFQDVPENHWAYQYISRASDKGWVNGVGDGRFSPSSPLLGREFTTMVTRAFCGGSIEEARPGSAWYEQYMDAARKEGLLEGGLDDDGIMGAAINRYNMALMINNLIDDDDDDNDDIESISEQIGDWDSIPEQYRKAVANCYALGLLTGVDDSGSFSGESAMNRAQAAAVLSRINSFINPDDDDDMNDDVNDDTDDTDDNDDVNDDTNDDTDDVNDDTNDDTDTDDNNDTSDNDVDSDDDDDDENGMVVVIDENSAQETNQSNAGAVSEESNSETFIARVVELVNEERAKNGLRALTVNAELQKATQVRAQELLELYSHTRPDGSNCFSIWNDYNISYTTGGENIAAGFTSPEAVMNGWMNSEGHRENILNPEFTSIGVGYVQNNWVQMFIG